MLCACGLSWDVGDSDPPKCRRVRHVPDSDAADRKLVQTYARAVNRVKPLDMPIALPEIVAREMIDVFRSHERMYGEAAAMQAAYRFMLRNIT